MHAMPQAKVTKNFILQYEASRFAATPHRTRLHPLREGGNHSWWHNAGQNRRSAIPRHNEINDHLARKICKDLGVPQP